MVIFGYIHKDTIIHKVDARIKFMWLILVMILAILAREHRILIVLGILIVGPCILARIRWKVVILPLLMWFGVFLGISFLLVYSEEISMLAKVIASFTITARIASLVLASLLFALTTNPQDMSYGLMKLRFPRRIAFVFGLALRFFPLIFRESERIRQARAARGADYSTGFLILWRFHREWVPVLRPLIQVSLKYSDEVTCSLISRGFDIERIKVPPYVRIRRQDLFSAAALVITVLLGLLLLYTLV